VKEGKSHGKAIGTADDLPPGAMPTQAELKKLRRLADRVDAGKERLHLLRPPAA